MGLNRRLMPLLTQQCAPAKHQTPRGAAVDLAVVLIFFCVAAFGEPVLDRQLRQGIGLAGVAALALYQFTLEGLALLIVMVARHERFSDYGLVRRSTLRSLALALLFTIVYDLAASWHAGALLWIPFRKHSAIRMALATGFPLSIVGISLTILVWGFFESFFGVFFARKLDCVFGNRRQEWFSPGALGFALFNGLIHLAIGQGFQGFAFSFASGYAIAVIPAVTGNAWGSALVQTLTNAVGRM